MGDVVTLKGQAYVPSPEPKNNDQEKIIRLLEELLEEAKDGVIREFAFAYVNDDNGRSEWGWSTNSSTLLGALEMAKSAMVKSRLRTDQ